ncbi:NnrU family protein [Aquabacterium sp.]|uniref:NnrU family protein n=1 Tax=Aquabacterium sp. TaxID=1872578 RepID=UPI002489D192|nr:NnrU family protein [Aquabacterium sp.]MDI1260324.1 NnrU family protein [Aquabacterium sp.]
MTGLVVGLLLFLGLHSIRIYAEGWRTRQLARMGEVRWKGLYTLVSLLGFGLIVWGYGQARMAPVVLWPTPVWTRHLAAPLTLVAFVMLAAANVPANHLKEKLGHPMLAGTKVWALAHLLANGTLADAVLFGSFLVWAVLCFRSSRRRDRVNAVRYPKGALRGDVITVVVGLVIWLVFAFWAHGWLIGVRPFG